MHGDGNDDDNEVELVSTSHSYHSHASTSTRHSGTQTPRDGARRPILRPMVNNSALDVSDDASDGGDFHVASHPSPLFHSLPRSHRLYTYVVIPLLTSFFVWVPLVIALVSYLSALQVLICWIIAVFLPLMLYQTVWTGLSDGDRTRATTVNGVVVDTSHRYHRAWLAIECVHGKWQHEVYQLLLTLLSCSVWITYTYHLSYVSDTARVDDYDYDLSLIDQSLILFYDVEYFLIASFSIDYLIGFFTSDDGWRYALSYYRLIDLLCFTGVAYFSFTGHGFAPLDATYSYYLLQGSLRFMRLRRALKALDSIASQAPQLRFERRFSVHLPVFAINIGPQQASRILVTFRVFLYLMSSAALVLALEFPCVGVSDTPGECAKELQSFHLCVYFIVVTFSTVGYGDIHCNTSLGRVAITGLIVGALVQVPAEMEEWNRVRQRSKPTEENDKDGEDGADGGDDSDILTASVINTRNDDNILTRESLLPAPQSQALSQPNVDDTLLALSLRSPLHAWAVRSIEARHSVNTITALCRAAGIEQSISPPRSPAIALVSHLFGEPA